MTPCNMHKWGKVISLFVQCVSHRELQVHLLLPHQYTPSLAVALFPGLHPHPAFVACSTKSGEKVWKDLSRDACCCWCHVL